MKKKMKLKRMFQFEKIFKLNNEEIAAKMSIQPDTVPNEVYKSFKKLKEIVDGIKE